MGTGTPPSAACRRSVRSPRERPREQTPVRVGVAGLGYWGPNLARNFATLPGCELRWLCDPSEQARARVAPQFPGARATAELDDLLADPELDAVVLATPVPTHAELAVRVARGRQALLRGEAARHHRRRRAAAPSTPPSAPGGC